MDEADLMMLVTADKQYKHLHIDQMSIWQSFVIQYDLCLCARAGPSAGRPAKNSADRTGP